MNKLEELIAQQQKGHEAQPRFMIGEQLKEIAAREPLCAEILEKDLTVKEMSLEAAERKFQEYADKNHKGAKTFSSRKESCGISTGFLNIQKRKAFRAILTAHS